MDYITSYLPDKVGLYYYLLVAACVLGALYLNDMLHKVSSYRGYDTKQLVNYGYDQDNGPSLWKKLFVHAGGKKQSPINLITMSAIAVPSEIGSLQFSEEFHVPPFEMKVYNSGLNALLYAKWCGKNRPSLTGGPLENNVYTFLNVRFRWGPSDHEGSEHMVDTKRFAMEMQVAFVKTGFEQCDILEVARSGNLLMVSYFFMVTPVDNPYLEPLVQAIKHSKFPLSYAILCPFPLKLLTPIFSKNYFAYDGSLTFPPCTEGVKWIIQSEPLVISSRQVRKFRKLVGCSYTPISTNSRPVQLANGREVFYYD